MLSVILVNWNGWADTLSCVQSILHADRVPARIIIVDNLSDNCSMEAFDRWAASQFELLPGTCPIGALAAGGAACARRVSFGLYREASASFDGFDITVSEAGDLTPRIYIVNSGRNGGFGFGCNVGMRLADYLGSQGYWLLNNDCVIEPRALSMVASALSAHPRTAFGTIVRFYDRPEVVQAFGGGSLSRRSGKNVSYDARQQADSLDYIYGASFAFSRELRSAVGDFDERIFMYYEEIDLCIRIVHAGFKLDVVETDVFHRHGGSQSGVSATAWRHVLFNKWYVLRKHFGWGLWMVSYSTALLSRCLNPFGDRRARQGARMALKQLVLKGVDR